MRLYRIQHRATGLGPYQHGGQIAEVVSKGIYCSTKHFPDLDLIPEVAVVLRTYPQALFAFTSKQRCLRSIRSVEVLERHGFALYLFSEKTLWHGLGQAVFLSGTTQGIEIPLMKEQR